MSLTNEEATNTETSFLDVIKRQEVDFQERTDSLSEEDFIYTRLREYDTPAQNQLAAEIFALERSLDSALRARSLGLTEEIKSQLEITETIRLLADAKSKLKKLIQGQRRQMKYRYKLRQKKQDDSS